MSVNSYLYLYQFVYLQDKSLLNLVQSYAILTSVQLVIEWFFTSVSLAIETCYQNMAVMAVWRRQWKRRTVIAIVNAVALAVWESGNLLIMGGLRNPSISPAKCRLLEKKLQRSTKATSPPLPPPSNYT